MISLARFSFLNLSVFLIKNKLLLYLRYFLYRVLDMYYNYMISMDLFACWNISEVHIRYMFWKEDLKIIYLN